MTTPQRYDVLRPVYRRTPYETPESTPEQREYWHRVQWLWLGTARDMQEAKARFGGSPVLSPLTN